MPDVDNTWETFLATSTSFIAGAGVTGFYFTQEVMPWLPMIGDSIPIALGAAFGIKTRLNHLEDLNDM